MVLVNIRLFESIKNRGKV